MMESARKKLKITTSLRGLWELNICVTCKNPLDSTSKILKCLHGMCNQCYKANYLVLAHFVCRCGEKTDLSTRLINYSFACEQFNRNNLSTIYFDQTYVKILYGKYRTKAPCPNCANKCIELYCITCTTFHCSLCQLMIHRNHEFKTVDDIRDELQFNVVKNKLHLCEKSNFLFDSKLSLASDINKLNTHKIDLINKVKKQFDEIRTEVYRNEHKMINYIETYYKGNLEKTNKAISAMSGLIEKYNFYEFFAGSVLKGSNKADLDITNLAGRQLENVNNSFKNEISKLDMAGSNIDLKVKFDDTLNQLIESVKIMTIQDPNRYEEAINAIGKIGIITSYPGYLDIITKDSYIRSTIVDQEAIKKIIDYNCARQERKRSNSENNESENNESSNSESENNESSNSESENNEENNESSNSANNESSNSANNKSSNSNTNTSGGSQAKQGLHNQNVQNPPEHFRFHSRTCKTPLRQYSSKRVNMTDKNRKE